MSANITDLTALRRTIEAGKALLNIDTTQLLFGAIFAPTEVH